jgi:hypothetical protein
MRGLRVRSRSTQTGIECQLDTLGGDDKSYTHIWHVRVESPCAHGELLGDGGKGTLDVETRFRLWRYWLAEECWSSACGRPNALMHTWNALFDHLLRITTGAQGLVGSSPTLLDWIRKTHSMDWSELDAGQKLASQIL